MSRNFEKTVAKALSGYSGSFLAFWLGVAACAGQEPVDIGSRLELFADGYLIERMEGARLQLYHPRPAGTVLEFDRPWEGVFAAYVTVIQHTESDGPRAGSQVYRMYYRGLPATGDGQAAHGPEHEVTCYAESRDGITWTKPSLGLVEVQGSTDNNVILARDPACHNFSPFFDRRTGIEPAHRFKALGGSEHSGLLAYVSADGIRWERLQEEPVFTQGLFDSQNVAFWSEAEELYVCYFRSWTGTGYSGYRWISRTTSKDFINWSEPVAMSFGDAPPEHYYTNQTAPYYRAPHLYVSVFGRFMPGRQVLTAQEAERLGVVGRYFGDLSDACFMTSRGGDRFDRTFLESFIRPGRGMGNWTSRTNYPALGIVQTSTTSGHQPQQDALQMSMYIQRDYAQSSHRLERLVLRPDGFVSVSAGYSGGEMITRPLVFAGRNLAVNFATSAAGELQVEIQDAEGTPLSGYGLADAVPAIGDELERIVTWKNGADVSRLAGTPVRLRFVLKDADLYAIRFR